MEEDTADLGMRDESRESRDSLKLVRSPVHSGTSKTVGRGDVDRAGTSSIPVTSEIS